MGRRSSRPRKSELPSTDDEDSFLPHPRRKRPKLNYADIENNYDDILDDEEDDDDRFNRGSITNEVKFENDQVVNSNNEDQDHLDDIDDEKDLNDDTIDTRSNGIHSRRSTTGRVNNKIVDDNDDESFNEQESEDDFVNSSDASTDPETKERRALKTFISREDDDDVFDDDRAYRKSKKRSKRSKQPSRSRGRLQRARLRKTASHLSEEHESEDDDFVSDDDEDDKKATANITDDTLQDELAELKNDSDNSQNSPIQRSLRVRKKDVNYIIPPPLADNLDELQPPPIQPSTPRRRGAPSIPNYRLFPTGGPFGGGDVLSVFGKNYSGVNSGNILAGGVDSDSSDDEVLAVGASTKGNTGNTLVKTKKKQAADADPLGVDMNIDFSAVGGLDNYINQLKEMVALPLLYPEVYQNFGITPPRGVLFHGPPGTGKTLMARALAASCSSEGRNITFFMRKGADCLSKWVGEAERQLRLLFEEAKKQQPSIIFFDEIDGLAPVRSSKQEQIHASIVSTLLALMDGMDNRGQVIVIGATNRPDAVDPALRRPGRFDREFYFALPDLKAREKILSIHTKKWNPPLSDNFLSKIAHLTKGYGGADLRALCTEAALNSIQRKYPQIYSSNDKLKIDPTSIHVAARDFMKALDKIVPSSARSTTSGSAPLPEHLAAILDKPLSRITDKLDKLVPRVKKLSSLEEAQFLDPTENDADGGFAKHEVVKRIELSRIHRPRLLITGSPGNGQQYLGSAVLNHLEGFNVQSLDLGSIFGDSTRTAENAIIQSFIEARRQKPSIIYIPNIDIWYETIPDSARSTLAGLLRSVSSNERILLLGVSETELNQLDYGLKHLFGLSDSNFVELSLPNTSERFEFFAPLWNALKMKPTEFLDSRKKRKLEILDKVDPPKEGEKAQDLKSFEKEDMRIKNTLKIKLAGLMDLFKTRYKRFRKPPIEPVFLLHLFEPPIPGAPAPAYIKENDLIVEVSTGRKFTNMDLDIIEERLWNGFYSEPKQFLKDIELIYADAVTLGDREKLIKASEMHANAQVAVEEISTPEFIDQCKGLRQREILRTRIHEDKLAKLQATASEATALPESLTNGTTVTNGSIETTEKELVEGKEKHSNGEAIVDASDAVHEEPSVGVAHNPFENEQPLIDNDGDHTVVDEKVQTSVLSVNDLVGPTSSQTKEEGASEKLKITEKIESVSITNGAHTSNLESVILNGTSVPSTEDNSLNEQPKDLEVTKEKDVLEEKEVSVEPEEIHEPEPLFFLDFDRVEKLSSQLADKTEGLTLEYLEQVNARLMDILWDEHHNWNRNESLDKISNEISYIELELQKKKEILNDV